MKLDILAFAAHPDDIEISCAGTLLHMKSLGKRIGIIDLTMGERGTRGNANLRMEEASHAGTILQLSIRENLHLPDCFFSYSEESLQKIIHIIRKYQPEIVLANSLQDRHPDHGRAAKLVADACFYSGLPKIITEYQNQNQEAWRPANLFHYIQDFNLIPDFLIDISTYIEQKMEIISCFKSQFYSPDSKEPETPISKADFLDFIRSKAKTYGREAGFSYAEGFNFSRKPGITDLFHLK